MNKFACIAIVAGLAATSACKKVDSVKVSDATIYAWRKHFGQLEVADVKRLKALELEKDRKSVV